jgi:aryl-alcohol dehydrogenase-like predicted oxidoreductase
MSSIAAAGPLIGMGCMRLSTERDRDEARAIAVLHAAFDAGATLLDTADAYCWDDSEMGHNERLIAQALSTWIPRPTTSAGSGDRSRILVATKGGLTRPQGNWRADGRARHLVAACQASLRALNVERIDLYYGGRARTCTLRARRCERTERWCSSWASPPLGRAPRRTNSSSVGTCG